MRKGSRWEVPEALKKKWAAKHEAADELKVSIDTIESWIADGRLKTTEYHGGHVLVSRESIKGILAPFV